MLSGIHQVGLQDVPKPTLVNDTDVTDPGHRDHDLHQ